jgi:hypothetical protein
MRDWLLAAFLAALAAVLLGVCESADLGLRLGDRPASDLVRAGLAHLLRHPQPLDVHLQPTQRRPWMPAIADGGLRATATFANLTLLFHQDTITVLANRVRIRSRTNLTAHAWPMLFGEEIFHMDLAVS